jgi:hypothetical protein
MSTLGSRWCAEDEYNIEMLSGCKDRPVVRARAKSNIWDDDKSPDGVRMPCECSHSLVLLPMTDRLVCRACEFPSFVESTFRDRLVSKSVPVRN